MKTKKLTCCDLMVGDWVYSTFSNKPCKVQAIELSEHEYCSVQVTGVDGVKDIVSLSPIPLTAEILEKNGWYIPTNSCWWHNNEIDFYLVGYTNGDFGIYTDGDSEFSDLCRINHVHELQNLYRICRFNKEIVL